MVLLVLIQIVIYAWSFLTWPIYFLIYRPWSKTSAFHRRRTTKVDEKKDQVTIQALPLPANRRGPRHQLLHRNVCTMDQVLKYGAETYANKKCLGVRRIREEIKEPGPNGKTFTKWVMESSYKWLTYKEVDKKSDNLGHGLQILGLKPRDKLVMYCDTKAEWMVTAMACFKFNYTLVTIYTNLGEEGVIYGINQTQANYVCTSQELLPKLVKVLDKVSCTTLSVSISQS